MANSKFVVWRRNDGYVDATTYTPNDWVTSDGEKVSFDILYAFEEWAPACEALAAERAKSTQTHSEGSQNVL